MADPVPYVRDFGFTDYQSINPDLPLPGISVDVELDAVQTSVGEIIDALATVRRSDGNLQDGVVSWDGLSDDVKARITGDDARVTIGDINPAAFAQQSEAVGVRITSVGLGNTSADSAWFFAPININYESFLKGVN